MRFQFTRITKELFFMEFFSLFYLATGPGIAIALYIYYFDKWEPEPAQLALKCFFMGALSTLPVLLYGELINMAYDLPEDPGFIVALPAWKKALYTFLYVAFLEESAKFLFLKEFAYNHREFNEPFDGIVYGAMIGCGFATVENIFYVFERGAPTGFSRLFTAVPMHAFSGILMGYFLGRAKFQADPFPDLGKGLLYAVLLHGAYNFFGYSTGMITYIGFVGVLFLILYTGLRAQRKLLSQSETVQSSTREFLILKDDAQLGPFRLHEIRDGLADWGLDLNDTLIEKETGNQQSIRDVLEQEFGSRNRSKRRIPSRGQALIWFFLIYLLTFGMYLFFWFHRNYVYFKTYKKLKLNPELRSLGLFAVTIFSFFIFANVMAIFNLPGISPVVEISLYLAVACAETAFLYIQFRIIKRYLDATLKRSFPIHTLLGLFFLSLLLNFFYPKTIENQFWINILIILVQSAVLLPVQYHLNRFWKNETVSKRMNALKSNKNDF